MPGKVHLALAATLGVGTAGLAVTGAADRMQEQPAVEAVIKSAEGENVGLLRVEPLNSTTSRVTVNVSNIPAGYHGIHIHTKGVCDARSTDPSTGSPFFSAGGHFNLGSGSHPQHAGDLPALLVSEDGKGVASAVTDRFRVKQLFDSDGSAVVIHAGPDNQAHIPDRYRQADGKAGPDADTLKTGDSGGRIACGVLEQR